MVSQGFFSGSADRKKRMAGSSDTKVALGGDNLGSMGGIGAIIGVGGLGIKGIQSAVEGGRRLKENIQRRLNPEEDNKQSFFSPRLNEVKVASNEVQPLSEIGSPTYEKEVQSYIKGIKTDPYHSLNYDEEGYRVNPYRDRIEDKPSFTEDIMRQNYPAVRQFLYDRNPLQYVPGQPLSKKKEDEGNILTKTGNFIANLFTPPAVAGTLEGKPTRFAGQADPTPRPKLDYVNPDKTTMTGSEIRDAFRPSNLFGYKDKFGRFGEAVDRDRQQTMNQVAQRYSSMPAPDARSLSQIRQDRAAKMKTDAEQRQARFKETGVQTFGGKIQPRKSADVTYGTNMLSNPAFGFRSKMKPEDQKKYDKSARDATEMARPDPSLGNVIAQTINRVSGLVGGPQMSLENIGERQLRLANKEVNRPSYQKEAFARNQLGITIGDIRARQRAIIEQNARARNEAFKAERAQKAAEKAAKRIGGNIGTGRDGGFGTGTSGQGVPSNPKGFSGYSRKSSPSSSSRSTSKSQGRGGSRGGSTGGSGSSSKGGTGSGGTKTSSSVKASKASRSRTGRSRTRCDVRTKIDIAPLTNPDLIRDDLANIAYFVKEIK